MFWGGETDKAYRKDRKERAKKKLDQLIDRLNVTIKDIERNELLSDKQKRSLRNHMNKRLKNL